jgi:hypothetical protein
MTRLAPVFVFSLVTVLTLGLSNMQVFADAPAEEGVTVPADDLMIDTLQVREGVAVPFDHSLHNFDCVQCHHMWDGESDIMPCSEAGCHDNIGMKELNSEYSYWNIMHKSKVDEEYTTCVACHRETFEDKSYDGCTGSVCHPKGYHLKYQ